MTNATEHQAATTITVRQNDRLRLRIPRIGFLALLRYSIGKRRIWWFVYDIRFGQSIRTGRRRIR